MKRLTLILISVLIITDAFSQNIEFSGNITQNTIWDFDTVKITGDVVVNSGYTLIIAEGTLIQFQGNYKISSVGSLRLLGTKVNNIVFTIKDTAGYSVKRNEIGWGGLELKYAWDGGLYGRNNSNDSTIIEYCRFEYSKYGALKIENFSKIRISHSVFKRNYGSTGAGINLKFSNSLINDCSFFENYSYNSGGAMYLWSASPKIYNSSFIKNEGSQGGAIDITGSSAWFVNNIFYFNSTYNGGAIKFHAFNGIMANNIICFNKATYGGGAVYGGSGQVLIVNNTICYNNSDYAPGIYVSDEYYIVNSIIWGNVNATSAPQQVYISDSRANPFVQNCVIEKGETYDLSLFTKFENVLFSDPGFIRFNNKLTYNRDSIINFWSIGATSLSTDKGINTYLRSSELNLKNDVNLNKRISNNVTDIGAFEFQDPNSDIPTFLSGNEIKNGSLVFPNPTRGNIWIDNDSEELLVIELFDMSGKFILSGTFEQEAQIDITQYHNGIYYLLIKDRNKSLKTIKVIKY